MKKILAILPLPFRRRALTVAGSLLLRALLNMVGLAVLLPVLALALDPASLEGGGRLARLYALGGFTSPGRFVWAAAAAITAVVALKCLLNWLLARIERRYVYDLYATLSRQLLIEYHRRGLPFIKARNSAVLARNINVVCLAFTAGILRPAAAIASETMLLLLLFGALLWYAPAAALLSLCIFLPATAGYLRLIRGRINRYGERENRAQREKSRIVAESLRGYADLELGGAFPMMLRRFDRAMHEVVATRSREADIGLLPGMVTELGLTVGIALLAALGTTLAAERGDAQLLFGIFAVAALRLMPSVRSLLSGWTTIRYNRYTIDVLYQALCGDESGRPSPRAEEAPGNTSNDMPEAAPGDASDNKPGDVPEAAPSDASDNEPGDAPEAAPLPFARAIEVRDLTFRFPDSPEPLFEHLSLTIRKGERIGIRGASGSGKTTLFNLLLGFYAPDAGTIAIDGVPLTAATRRRWQQRVGYVSQHLFLIDGTFAENVALGRTGSAIDRQRVAEVLATAQLGDFIATLPAGIDTPVGECGCRLSGGQRQRIGIARALYRRADVLLFDEATSALDDRTEQEVNRAIARLAAADRALTLLVIAHRASSLAACDRIIHLGKAASDPEKSSSELEELLSDAEKTFPDPEKTHPDHV